jgi:hypothetical protein
MSSPLSAPAWFTLVDSDTGEPFKGIPATKVVVSSHADVKEFRKAVMDEFRDNLAPVNHTDLLVYKNKSDFNMRKTYIDEANNMLLSSTDSLHGLGESYEDMLVVQVPSEGSSRRHLPGSILSRKELMPARYQRWIRLNEVLEGDLKSQTNDSTYSSNVNWNQFKGVFNPVNYV